jgi:hypothetical protein
MSPDQVIAASNGNARAIPDTEVKKYWSSDRYISSLVKGNHIVDGERFEISFPFAKTSKRLQRVDLSAADFPIWLSNLMRHSRSAFPTSARPNGARLAGFYVGAF